MHAVGTYSQRDAKQPVRVTVTDTSGPIVLVLMYLGLISDILDGIIARKQQVSSARLRRLDSQTDMVFWLSIVATWMLSRNLHACFPLKALGHHFADRL